MPNIPFGFCGPGYTSQSKVVDGERCVNLYPELVAPGAHGKSGIFLNKTAGTKKFATLPGNPPGRGLWAGDNRLFAAGGSKLYEILPNGTPVQYGDFGLAVTPVTVTSNGNELFVTSGANGYISDASRPIGDQLKQIVAADLGAYLDGFLIGQSPNTNQFVISDLLNGQSWNPLDFGQKTGGPDRLCAIYSDHEELWLIGFRTTEVWYLSGAANFPFQKIQGAFVEDGCTAPFSVAKVDNSMMFLEGSDRGAGVVVRMQGYTPTRVSNHAVEYAIQRYPIITDAIGVSRSYLGHSFYEIHFPSADACWVYDVATGMWHERLRWDSAAAKWHEHPYRYHAYGNYPSDPNGGSTGQHFVQDYRTGAVYIESVDNLDLDGEPIRWLRSSPHVSDHLDSMYFERLIIDMQTGGSTGVPGGNFGIASPFLSNGGDPQVSLRCSDDGGNTWDSERIVTAGRIGEYEGRFRVQFNQLGRSFDRCFELSGADPIQIAIVDANLRGYRGSNPA